MKNRFLSPSSINLAELYQMQRKDARIRGMQNISGNWTIALLNCQEVSCSGRLVFALLGLALFQWKVGKCGLRNLTFSKLQIWMMLRNR